MASREMKPVFCITAPIYVVKTGLSHVRRRLEGRPRSKLTGKEWLLSNHGGAGEWAEMSFGGGGVGGDVGVSLIFVLP